MIKTVKNGSGTWEYAYDAWGNVSKATENGSADRHTYTYDAQGQLTREYDPDKKLYLGYQYDAGGNLTEVRSYPAGAEGGPDGTGTVLKTFCLWQHMERPAGIGYNGGEDKKLHL